MRHRGITPQSQREFDTRVADMFDHAHDEVRKHLIATGYRGLVRTQYEHDMAGLLAEWKVGHNTPEDQERYPFCWECGQGHDIKKVSCEQVAEMIDADQSIGL